MISVRVLLFAAFREAARARSLDLSVPQGTTLDALFRLLEEEYPSIGPLRPYTTFAVNRDVTGPDTVLHDRDEVAFLQPVSGGSHD